MRIPSHALVVAIGLAGCGTETVDAVDRAEQVASFDLDDCGITCGDGPVLLLDALQFAGETDEGLPGFDLDGVDGDCDKPDHVGTEGTSGVDNQFGTILDTLPSQVTDLLPDALADRVRSGELHAMLEVVGAEDLRDPGPVAVVVRRGAGDVMVGADGRLLPGQTNTIHPDDPILGSTTEAQVGDGWLEVGPFDFALRFSFLGTPVEAEMRRAFLRIDETSPGRGDLLVGGIVPLESALSVASLVGGIDQPVQDLLNSTFPLMVDGRTEPGGDCDGISMVITGEVVSGFLYETPGEVAPATDEE